MPIVIVNVIVSISFQLQTTKLPVAAPDPVRACGTLPSAAQVQSQPAEEQAERTALFYLWRCEKSRSQTARTPSAAPGPRRSPHSASRGRAADAAAA